MTGWYSSSWKARSLEYGEGGGFPPPFSYATKQSGGDKTHRPPDTASRLRPTKQPVCFTTERAVCDSCVFDELPETIVLEDVETSLSNEYLLNEDGRLEIHKKYLANGKQAIWIYALHPSNEGFDDLLLKKNNELKTKIRSANLQNMANLTINSDMRRVLWQSLGDENNVLFKIHKC